MYFWIYDKYSSTNFKQRSRHRKMLKYNNFSITIMQWLHGTVAKDLTSLVVDSEGGSSNHGKALLLNFVHFFSPLACFPIFSLLIL